GDGVRGRGEGKARNHHLRERVPWHVDPDPEAVRAEQDGVAGVPHPLRELGPRVVPALHEERPPRQAQGRADRGGDRVHVPEVWKEKKSPPGPPPAAKPAESGEASI